VIVAAVVEGAIELVMKGIEVALGLIGNLGREKVEVARRLDAILASGRVDCATIIADAERHESETRADVAAAGPKESP
jgi:hypothetical protein